MFTIGNLSARAGVSIDTIRFYERRGLIEATDKTAAGYHLYEPAVLRRIAFIKHAQRCDISLDEIKVLFAASDSTEDGQDSVVTACRLAEVKAQEIIDWIPALQAMADALTSVVTWCGKRTQSPSQSPFPVLAALEAALDRARDLKT